MGVVLPDWAATMLDVIGVSWPNVDEDDYHHTADSLRDFAHDLDDNSGAANQHMQRLLSSGRGQSMEALSAHWGKVKDKHLKDLATAARVIAGALDLAAGAITAQKGEAITQLGYLADETGIALALIPETGGLSALLDAGAIEATQQVVKQLFKEVAKDAVGYIVSALTEPAVAALDGMAVDLAIQLAADGMGVQDGVNLNEVKQAGKEGFHQGVGSAKAALHLDSVGSEDTGGGRGGGGSSGDVLIDHAEHERASTHLNTVGASVRGKTSGHIVKARLHLGRTRGKGEIAKVIERVAEKAINAVDKAATELGDHLKDRLPKAVQQISKDFRNTDQDIKDRFSKLEKHRGRNSDFHLDSKRHVKESPYLKPDSLRDAKSDPRRHGIPLNGKTCKNDPVDVATGEMTLPQTDLALPGVLPLVLRRTHLSEYRYGQWFGRSWTSTLDERIELDTLGTGAIWAREDGSLLVYPHLPQPGGEPILPLEGPRLPLTHGGADNAETTYRVSDPRTGLTRWFTGSPYNESTAYWLTEITDRNGNRITIDRYSDGTPTTVVHDGGYTVRLTTEDARIRTLALRTPDGPVTVTSYGYDEAGNLNAVTNSSGLPLRFTYDPDGRITSWTDRNDSTFRYVYDGAGRVIETVGPDGILSSTFAYGDVHPATGHRITRYTNSTGATTAFYINRALQVIAETDPLGITTRFDFDTYDRLLAHTDALGNTTRFERDALGNLVGLVAPDGVRTTATYNEMCLPIEVTERGGLRCQYVYDDRGNLITRVDPTGARTEYEFNDRGHVTGVRNAVGDIMRITTDAAGLPLEMAAPDGTTTVCTRDVFGRITEVTDAMGGVLRQGWTVEGKPAWRELPDGTREEWTWDGEGNLLSHTDRMGRTSTHTATHFDRRAATRTREGGDYRFTYDTELRLTKVTNAQNLEWQYTYDAAGRLVAETDFDGRTLSYEHDALGRLVRRTNAAGQTLTFERDVLGRVTQLRHDDGSTSSFTYDETGRAREITNAHAHIVLERDTAGRVVAETVNGQTMAFAYDVIGRRTHRRTPSGASSDLTYNWAGLASYTAGSHTFHFDRDALGREKTRTLDGTLTFHQDWDSVGRVTRQQLSTPHADLLEREFTYQADGSPVSIHDHAGGQRSFTVDESSRITSVQAERWTEQYAYNTVGDQIRTTLSAQVPGQDAAGTRTYDGTRIIHAGRTRYTYDAQGRLTLRETRTLSGKMLRWCLEWDAEDRLTHVRTPTNIRWRYLYDALGRRIAKQRLDTEGRVVEATSYVWDGAQLAEQRTNGTTLVWDYVGLRPLAQRESKTDSGRREIDRRFFAIVTDLTGSPSELFGLDGTCAWRARSTAWGATQWASGSTAYTPLRYPGQYFDPETGLHYNVNRYYDPDLGRYITPDPLGLAPAVNHYAYVPNPFTLADPLGLAGCENDPTWGGRVKWTQDEHGRPYEMNAIITRDMLDEGTHARGSIRPPGYQSDVGLARGHMLARMLGGSGDIEDNLFTITQNPTNSPEMRDFEQAVYDAVHGGEHRPGEIAHYNVYLEYGNDDRTSPPKYIQLEAYGHRTDAHGRPIFSMEAYFTNPAHDLPRPNRHP